MKKFLSVCAAVTLTCAAAPAFAVDINLGCVPNNSFCSGSFASQQQTGGANTFIPVGDFTHTFNFTIPLTGLLGGSLTTQFTPSTNNDLSTDVDLSSIMIDGFYSFVQTGFDITNSQEVWSISDLNLAGGLHTLEIAGHSFDTGSYGGQMTFASTPGVPEPSTWAMMLVGFGLIGFGLRRRREKVTTRVRFAMG